MAVFFLLREYNGYAYEYSRTMLFYFCVSQHCDGDSCPFNLIRICLRKIRKSGFNLRHIIFVGYSSAAEAFIDRIYANPQWGYRVCGILDDNKETGYTYKNVPVLGTTEELEQILENNRLERLRLRLLSGNTIN